MLKTGQQEKLYPPTDVSVSQQRRPQLLSAKFENLIRSIFRNETSTLETNVSHFGVLHWQQWQPPAFAPEYASENGPTAAVRKFEKQFPNMNESTARTFKKKYESELDDAKRQERAKPTSVPLKPQGRPLLLGGIRWISATIHFSSKQSRKCHFTKYCSECSEGHNGTIPTSYWQC